MEKVRESDKKYLPSIRKNIECSYNYFKDNIDSFWYAQKFIFDTTLSENDKSTCEELEKPALTFNVIESYISRLCGEFAKTKPSFKVEANSDAVPPLTIKAVEEIIKNITLSDFEMQTKTYRDLLAGGFSAWKLKVDYKSNTGFHQKIVFEKVDPTLVGFDPLAKCRHKGDGNYVFEYRFIDEDTFKEIYKDVDVEDLKNTSFGKQEENGFKWYSLDKKMISIVEYYKKERVKFKLYLMSNGESYKDDDLKKKQEEWSMLPVAPTIVAERESYETEIVKYTLTYNKIIKVEKLPYFSELPIIFIDGNSVYLRGNQKTRSYLKNVFDAQRLKNFVGIEFASSIGKKTSALFLSPIGAIPENDQNWKNIQKADILEYNPNDTITGAQLAPPIQIPPQPVNPQYLEAFQLCDKNIESALGAYEAELGISNKEISGEAILMGATQSSASSMPYMIGYISSLEWACHILKNLIPYVYSLPQSIKIPSQGGGFSFLNVDSDTFNYDKNMLGVTVSPGANLDIQKSRSVKVILALMSQSQTFAEIINSKGLPVLLDNIEIRGSQELKNMTVEYLQEQEQQSNASSNAPSAEQQAIILENKKIELTHQENMAKLSLEEQKFTHQQKIDALEAHSNVSKMADSRLESIEKSMLEQQKIATQEAKIQAERMGQIIDLLTKSNVEI
jgi:hypothetical protein